MKAKKLQVLVLFVFSFLLYCNTLQHDYVLDDFSVIKENFVVKKGIDGIPTIWKTHYRYGYGFQKASLYRPLSLTLFAIQWELAPDNPQFAHAINILLYSLLAVILFVVLLNLFGQTNWLLSFLTTLLFIAHPIHTEVVANIKSVDDILVFSLCLLAYLLLFNFLSTKKTWLFVVSILLIGCAFFAKESTFTLVLCIPIILVLFKEITWGRAFQLSAFYLIPTAFYFFVRFNVLGSISNSSIEGLDNVLVTAPNLLIKWATALKIMGLYVYKLVIPHPLMNDYSMNEIELNGLSNPFTWLSLLLFIALIWAAIKWWKSKKVLSFGILFFLVNFSLYTNLFVTIGTSFGERLLFIPSLGFSICIAYILIHYFGAKSTPFSLSKQPKLLVVSAIILCLYSFKTFDRNKDWKNNLTLYSEDVVHCENSARCQYHYGIEIMKTQALTAKNEQEKKKFLTVAIQSFERAIAIHSNYSEAYADLGLAYFRMNNYPKAEQNYLKATQLNSANATAFSNLGSLYFNTQRYQQAKTAYEQTLKINPNHIDGLANYASTLGTLGDYQGAILHFKKAIKLNPNKTNYYQMVGITYKNLGNTAEANRYFELAKKRRN